MSRVSNALVKWRLWLLAAMAAVSVACAFLIQRVNVDPDMTHYLPENSQMNIGMKRMEESLPDLDQHMRMVGIMIKEKDLAENAPEVLDSLTGHLTLDSVREKGPFTLYRFNINKNTDTDAIKAAVAEYYGDSAVVEVDGDNLVMTGIGKVLLIGFILIFIVLFIMCKSVMEGLLFLTATGVAILLNMGTNYFLGTVSLITHSLAAIMQMVLSMDYSIILMNRYREEKKNSPAHMDAMARAIDASAPTILSSALTTFVGLIMLVFIKFKIGPDLGWVLSKGVVFSLLCNFTVLPALILLFDKAIVKSSKKTPSLPVAPIARFERAFCWPITVLFAVIFIGSAIFQKKTEISFSAVWSTPITEQFPPDNPFMVLYSTEDEGSVPGVLDSLSKDSHVLSTLSYPSLAVKQYSAGEMASQFADISPLVTEDLLKFVYYAQANPSRTERFRLSELEESANLLADAGLIRESFDIESLAAPLMESAPEEPEPEPAAIDTASIVQVPDTTAVAMAPADTVAASQPSQASPFTYTDATTPLTAGQVADLVGADRRLISLVYRMAGKKGKGATMEPYLLVRFVRDEVLTDKRFAKMVPPEDTERIHEVGQLMDSIVLAGPPVLYDPSGLLAAAPDTAQVIHAPLLDSLVMAEAVVPEAEPAAPVPEEPEYVPTPLEVLAEMAFTDGKYSSARVYRAFRNAGLKVSREEMDLLYLYTGSRLLYDESQTMSVGGLLNFATDTLLANPAYASIVPEEVQEQISGARDMLASGTGVLRSEDLSLALVMTDYPDEAPSTFGFVEGLEKLSEDNLPGEHYVMGTSVMYKELKDGFPRELLMLTLLTVIAIFVIVALTFRSLLIPTILIMTVLSGVYINVISSGLGGKTMLYLSYLIIQGVLMGATIDYSILFTNYYRHCRKIMGIRKSLAVTYYRTANSILTSGLILVIVPLAMSRTAVDQMTGAILHSLGIGALAVILMILFVLPGVLAALDRLVVPAAERYITTGNNR